MSPALQPNDIVVGSRAQIIAFLGMRLPKLTRKFHLVDCEYGKQNDSKRESEESKLRNTNFGMS
jgi:hypothetical protein